MKSNPSVSHLVGFSTSFGISNEISGSHLVESSGCPTLRRVSILLNNNRSEEDGPSKVGPLLPQKVLAVVVHWGLFLESAKSHGYYQTSNSEDVG